MSIDLTEIRQRGHEALSKAHDDLSATIQITEQAEKNSASPSIKRAFEKQLKEFRATQTELQKQVQRSAKELQAAGGSSRATTAHAAANSSPPPGCWEKIVAIFKCKRA